MTSPQAVENTAAFAKLTGYIRYFYPGDNAAALDWDRFLVENVESVTSAPDSAALADQLAQQFAPIAPLAQVYPTGRAPDLPAELSAPPAAADHLIMWVYVPLSPLGSRTADMGAGERVLIPVGQTSFDYTSPLYMDQPGQKAVLTINDPASPYRADLGGGVSASIPLALYVSGDAPRATPAAQAAAPLSGDSCALHLAAVIKAWTVFQHFFSYWDVVHSDWQAALPDALAAITGDSSADFDTLRRMLALLHDGHSQISSSASPQLQLLAAVHLGYSRKSVGGDHRRQ